MPSANGRIELSTLNTMPLTEWVPSTLAGSSTAIISHRCQSGQRSATVWMASMTPSPNCAWAEWATTLSAIASRAISQKTAYGARRRQASGSAPAPASRYTHQDQWTESLKTAQSATIAEARASRLSRMYGLSRPLHPRT